MADIERNELLETIKNLTEQLETTAAQLEKVTTENAALHRKLERMNELLL